MRSELANSRRADHTMPTKPTHSKRRTKRLKRRTPIGAPPGTMIADPAAPRPKIRVIAYGPDAYTDEHPRTLDHLKELLAAPNRPPVVWIDVVGLGDAATISGIGSLLGLHKLALEDVINVHQRSKLDLFPGSLFFVARMAEPPPADSPRDPLTTDQLSLFLGPDYVVTFQERPGDSFDPVRSRLREDVGRTRAMGPDYLAYALIDAAIDAYFPFLEGLGERLEAVEDRIVLGGNGDISSAEVHRIKRDLLTVRRAMWPLRDALGSMYRDTTPLIKPETRLFLRDCYDHTVQIIDLVETYREIGSDLMDVYLTQVNTRINEVMKMLAIIATLFIPLNFVAALYGMNFDPDASPWNMPELRSRYGYPAVLALMASIAAAMFVMFWRRGWIGRRKPPTPAPADPSRARVSGEQP